MLFERYTISLSLFIGLLAVGLQLWFHTSLAFYILFFYLIYLVAIWFKAIGKVERIVKVISTGKQYEGISSGLKIIETRLNNQQIEVTEIAKVLERIDDKAMTNVSDLNIDVNLGNSILNLQKKLVSLKQEESEHIWTVNGIERINEIRNDNSDIEAYAFKIVAQLVKYLGANQGAFYVVEGEGHQQHLLQLSTYAYSRRKYTQDKVRIDFGTGLIGQCVLDKEIIFLTEIPQDYIKITSGLGEALPRCIVIAPLVSRDIVFGVIELAFFQKIEQHKLDFIKRASESIAFELSGIKTQKQTRMMLEQSQEAELRKNLEEMRATQFEMQRKEEELSLQLISTKNAMTMAEVERRKNEAILEGCMDAVISFNELGIVEHFNKAAEEIFGYSRAAIIGTSVHRILDVTVVKSDYGEVVIRSGKGNEVNIRTEVNAADAAGDEITLLLTATKVKIDNYFLFTLFAQKVSVDLF